MGCRRRRRGSLKMTWSLPPSRAYGARSPCRPAGRKLDWDGDIDAAVERSAPDGGRVANAFRRWWPTVVPGLPPTGADGRRSLKPTPGALTFTIVMVAAAEAVGAGTRTHHREGRRERGGGAIEVSWLTSPLSPGRPSGRLTGGEGLGSLGARRTGEGGFPSGPEARDGVHHRVLPSSEGEDAVGLGDGLTRRLGAARRRGCEGAGQRRFLFRRRPPAARPWSGR